ncbi:superinfection immunity protein [Gemmata obscuriglobus]|uniref:superinfection immunity protein n=1 Tax=Gemmata obscuriglobus TaxID=114 RepID=UPI00016C577B|nr:superinfection immunity protein [Gemmata obscuriglobus]
MNEPPQERDWEPEPEPEQPEREEPDPYYRPIRRRKKKGPPVLAIATVGVLFLVAIVSVVALLNRAKNVQDQARAASQKGTVKSSPPVHSERPIETPVRATDYKDELDREDSERFVTRILALAIGLPIYLLPTGVAVFRRHNNLAPIVIVNVFLGLIFVGWVVALAWSVSDMRPMRTERPV